VLIVLLASCSAERPALSAPSTAATSSTTAPASTSTNTTTAPLTTPSESTTTTTTNLPERAAEDLAAELTNVERASATGDGSVGQRQQFLYRYLATHVDLVEPVIALLGDDVRPFAERVVRARQVVQARQAKAGSPSDTLPAWTIVEPLPVDELLGYYQEAEAITGVPWYWLAAVHLQETRVGRIVGVSSAGAVGPMQFLPGTWARCCQGDPTVPRDAIIGAATYLSQSGGPDDMQAALNQYNPNAGYVATVTAFADNLRNNPNLYAGYHEWQVYFASSVGSIRLPVGYSQSQPIDAATYFANHPEDAGE
jgi:hypothetical protein